MEGNVARTKQKDLLEQSLAIAKKLQHQEKNIEAIAKYREILAIQPNFLFALNQLGRLYETENKLAQAIEYYQRVVELDPNNGLFYVRLGRAMLENNNIAAAIAAYKKGISLKPDSKAWVYHGLGDALAKNGQTEQAIASYRQALKREPKNPETIQRKIDRAFDSSQQNLLVAIAKNIQREAPYTGGPIQSFEVVGRDTIITLLQNGLSPNHKILDFGCGALRLGYWIIRLVDRGNYYGIEPNMSMLQAGIKHSLGTQLIKDKRPKFSNNSDCDFAVFGTRFNFVVARSIFTHTTPALLRKSLESFKANSSQNGVMLASYWPQSYTIPGENGDLLPLSDSRFIKIVTYSLSKIESWAEEFGLQVSEYRENPTINQQVWLKFEHL